MGYLHALSWGELILRPKPTMRTASRKSVAPTMPKMSVKRRLRSSSSDKTLRKDTDVIKRFSGSIRSLRQIGIAFSSVEQLPFVRIIRPSFRSTCTYRPRGHVTARAWPSINNNKFWMTMGRTCLHIGSEVIDPVVPGNGQRLLTMPSVQASVHLRYLLWSL